MKRWVGLITLIVAFLGIGMLGGCGDLQSSKQRITNWEQRGLQGKVMKTESFESNSGEQVGHEIVEFYSTGILKNSFFSWKGERESEYLFDNHGRLVKEFFKGDEKEYRYDVNKVMLLKSGKMLGEGVTDEYGNIKEMNYSDGTKIKKGDREYTPEGWLKKIRMEQGHTILYEYNKKGQITKRIVLLPIDPGEKEIVTLYSYDEKGNLLEEKTIGAQKNKSYEYLEFDGKGNWLKRRIYHEFDIPFSDETRKITYYE